MTEERLLSRIKPKTIHLNISAEFCWIKARKTADVVVFRQFGKYLSDIEIKVLEGSWQGKTYDELAAFHGYSAEYLNKDVGNKLWKKLSAALCEPVTKRNFRAALNRAWDEQKSPHLQVSTLTLAPSPRSQSIETSQSPKLAFPEGAVALDSPFYVERSGVETLCCQTLQQPGSLIRIKAPKLMGKTSLINRMLTYAKEQVGEAVYLDLGSCDRSILTDLDKFLRRFCVLISQQLGLENRLNDYWDTDILGSNDNCTAYFEEYLLPQLDGPLVLALDESDRLFAYPEVAEDVLGMLRSWHEKGKVSLLWQRLRLVIAHSTEIYIPLDINQSPFNAGLPIELKEFAPDQVMALAQLHGLELSPQQIPALMQVVCGHPYLIRLALYKLCTSHVTLEQLIDNAACESGLYSAHLRRHLEVLQQSPDLIPALQQVIEAKAPVALSSIVTYKLHSMGLVQLVENCVVPRCDLYRKYFCRALKM